MRLTIATLACGLVLLSAAPVRAADEWYGWENLLVDTASLALIVGGATANSDIAPAIGVLGYALGSPMVHWAHGQGWRGATSLGMRVGPPLVAVGLASAAFSDCNGDTCWIGPLVLVAGVTIVNGLVAIIVDAAALAYEPPPPEWMASSIQPLLATDGRRGVVGVQGVF